MKINKKILVPVLALTAFVAVGVGSTYAIFTSKANTNIAVTAGKVSVTATVENVKLYSGVYNEDTGVYDSVVQTTNFLNGGTVTVENGVVTLDKVTPMDKVEFDVKVKNASNVTAKYRTLITKLEDTGLFEGLSVKVNDVAFSGGDSYTNWEVIEPTTTDVATLHVVVELPEEAGNDYQDKSCSIKFAVEAVQGNAFVANQVVVNNQSELATAIATVEEGTEIVLGPSETAYTVPSVSNKDITIVGADTANTKVSRSEGVGVPGSSLTFKNVTMVGGTGNYIGFQHTSKENYEDCVFTGKSFFYAPMTIIKNCTFNQDIYDYHFWVYGAGTTKFEGCTFNNLGKAAKVYSEATEGVFNVEFKNCRFVSSENTHDKPAVAVNSLGATYNITVTNCTTTNYNCNDDSMATWYSTRMASATEAEKLLVGAEGQIDKVKAIIDGTTY